MDGTGVQKFPFEEMSLSMNGKSSSPAVKVLP